LMNDCSPRLFYRYRSAYRQLFLIDNLNDGGETIEEDIQTNVVELSDRSDYYCNSRMDTSK